jgi:Protein of unknown function (DUF642)
MKNLLSIGSIAVSSLALNLLPVQQAQAVNLVVNGDFTQNNATAASAYLGKTNNEVVVTGWTFGATHGPQGSFDKGYNFLVSDGATYSTGMAVQNNIYPPGAGPSLYGTPGQLVNSVNNTGWYIAADAWYDAGSISQTLNGLTFGQQYTVKFSQAAGQQTGFTGNETEYFKVGFGNSSQNSTVMNITSKQPVSAWQSQSLTFTAGGASQVLSFLAQGTKDVPPFALLSGISVEAVPATAEAVPEPENFVGTLIGLGFIGTLIKSRLAKKKLAEQD